MDTQTAPIDVTERAAVKARELASREGHALDACLRVRIVAGGCSGFSYKLSFEDVPADDDLIVERFGMRVLVDPASVPIRHVPHGCSAVSASRATQSRISSSYRTPGPGDNSPPLNGRRAGWLRIMRAMRTASVHSRRS